jgi:hypothetical protein
MFDSTALALSLGRGFFDFLPGLSFIRSVGLWRSLLALGLGIVAQANEHRKMVRAEIRQALQLDQPEVGRVKEMIEWKAQKEVLGMKRVIEPATDARIEQPADFLK